MGGFFFSLIQSHKILELEETLANLVQPLILGLKLLAHAYSEEFRA